VVCAFSRDDGGLIYGTGDEAGNERGFLVGVSACQWSYDDAPKLPNNRPMRITATYNSSEPRYGAMMKWMFMVLPDIHV